MDQNTRTLVAMDPDEAVSDEHRACPAPAAALAQLIQTNHTRAPFSDPNEDRSGRISAIMRHIGTARATPWYRDSFCPPEKD
jgi:hypothetical protein